MSTNDVRYAFEIRRALLDQTNHLPSEIKERLAHARRTALARKKQHVVAGVGVDRSGLVVTGGKAAARFWWIGRVGAMAPILAGAVMFFSLYQFEQNRRILDTAEIDAAVLADELPLSAYVDYGFNAFVENGGD